MSFLKKLFKKSIVQEAEKAKTWFDEVHIGSIACKNRVFMSPLTRMRGNPQTGVGNNLVIEYYKQRADFGLIFTEASSICQLGVGNPGSCNIYTKEQTQFWKKCVEEVHKAGGKIVIQLWHHGRATHPQLNGGLEVWAPSPIYIKQKIAQTGNQLEYPVPKEMTQEDIKLTLKEYKAAAENALLADFDGVELHGANGYLIDQFLKDGSNQRKDQYGGSVENRCRFPLEVMDQLIGVFGKERTGIRISPTGRFQDMYDSDPLATFSYFLKQLDSKGIAFVEIKESGDIDKSHQNPNNIPSGVDQIRDCGSALKPFFQTGKIISNDSFTPETGLTRIQSGIAEAISFGRLAINNPDLPNRIKNNWPLNKKYDFNTFFGGGAKGYTDLPIYTPHPTKE